MINNPDNLVALWMHRSDGYETSWGDWRKSTFFHYGFIPYTMIDATIQSSSGVFQTHIDQRLAVPTDVTLELGATEVATDTYLVTVEVCVELTGAMTTMNLHILDVLDYIPMSPTWYRNCVRQGFRMGTITVGPGSCAGFQQEIVFDADSMASPNEIKVAAFVEQPLDIGPGEVYQSEIITWPLPTTNHPLFSSGVEDGTLNCWSRITP